MLRSLVLGLCLVLSTACTINIGAQRPDIKELRIATKLVKLPTDPGNGSGVVIAPNRVLTAGHVVDFTTATEGITVDGKPAKVIKVTKTESGLDLALLEVEVACPCYPISDKNGQVDDEVVAIGYPMYNILKTQVATYGSIQKDSENRFVLNVPVYFGNSGGPIFRLANGKWELVGIVVTMIGYYYGPIPHLSGAMDTQSIREFLK